MVTVTALHDSDGTGNNLLCHTLPLERELSGAAQPVCLPYWLIAKYTVSRISAFTIRFADGEEALPVFGGVEEAERFLRLAAPEGAWRIRETGAGELVSILFSVGKNVRRVVLDPPSETDFEVWADLVSMGRRSFIEFLVSRARSQPTEAESKMRG